jgi:hypothetical protein
MTERVKTNGKAFLIGIVAGMFASILLFINTGCSTVSGLAKDLGAASEGLRQAMTQEEE